MDRYILASRVPVRRTLRSWVTGVLLVIGLLVVVLPVAAAPDAPHPEAAPTGQSTIGDYVWYDADADGAQDAGESPIAGALLELWIWDGAAWAQVLWDHDGNPGTPPVPYTDTTDAAGQYLFNTTAYGNLYEVRVADSNYAASGPLYGYVHTSYDTYSWGSGYEGVASLVQMPNVPLYDFLDADFGFVGFDWGDLPDTPHSTLMASNGPRHLISSALKLGATIDAETDGQPNGAATGDDSGGLAPDDEDGVRTMPGAGTTGYWTNGTVAGGDGGSLEIVIGGSTGVPQVFIDFGNGLTAITLRTSSGTAFPTSARSPGTYRVYFDIPAGVIGSVSSIPVRVRLSSTGGLSAAGAAPGGKMPDGEVEDYIFNFSPTALSLVALSARPAALPAAFGAAGIAAAAAFAAWWRRARRVAAVRL